MAKSKSSSTQHTIHGGKSSRAAPVSDSSRTLSKGRSVNDEATRSGVAVGKGTGSDGGVLK